MQILQHKEYITFISEDPTYKEEDKVQIFYWIEIEKIMFYYEKSRHKIFNILKLIGGFFIGFDASSIFSKKVSINILFKNGEKVSIDYYLPLFQNKYEFEKHFLNNLKCHDKINES